MIRLNENKSVRLAGLRPEMDTAMYVVESILKGWCIDAVITAGTEEFYPDGTLIHSIGSYHPRGYALDFRTREIPPSDLQEVTGLIQTALKKIDPAYGVQLEGNHLHVQWSVKKAFKETQNADY